MDNEDYVKTTIQRAQAGDPEAAIETLRLCRTGLSQGNISSALSEYLSMKLEALDNAIKENDALRTLKASSGSIRSDRLAAIENALGISKQTGRPKNPFPDWQAPYAAIGIHLQRNGIQPELIKSTLDLIRKAETVGSNGLDRSQASRILKNYSPLIKIGKGDLREMARPLLHASQMAVLEKKVVEKIADLFAADF